MRISIIVAMSENRVIGLNNQMPWRLSTDLKLFKKITMGHPIIMGRKTFDSIGRILPGREHLIISRQKDHLVAGATVISSLDRALEIAAEKTDEVFIIGGGEIYRQALARATRIYLTQIHQVIEGDTYFPEFSQADFKEVSREDLTESDIHFSYFILDRV